jgi:solute carrier family 29 (equilibrative nucleoside transporter), member 1/2/3
MSTLIGSIYRIFTKLVFPTDKVVSSSLLYFYCGAGTIGFCMLCYKWLLEMDISKKAIRFGLSPYSRNQLNYRDREMDRLLPSAKINSPHEVQEMTNYQTAAASLEEGHLHTKAALTEEELFSAATKYKIFILILPALSVVFVMFFTTLALWPALVTEIPSYNFPHLQETSWWSLLLLFNFAATDCLGRLLVDYRGMLTKDNIWIFAVLRVFCLPALVCCSKGWVFTNDFWSVLFVAILGYTNGYLGSLSILMVNEWIDDEYKGLAGTFTGFTLNAGLVVGATAAVFVENAVKNL